MDALLPNRNYEQFPPSVFPPLDAVAWGFDFYGLWKTLDIAGVQQTMRWIPPGDFMMGSPKSEGERRSNELLHQVTLTIGFWLADTTCTQTLWSAVMVDNPSRFQGEQRPVEGVSWDDVGRFIDRCNGLNPVLRLCLPTEAQWEYACRAGTSTPFNIGETISPAQVNYDGNYPYSGGVTGEYRKETVDVKLSGFNANHWGLFQMHGNVWEWCKDWYDQYENVEAVVDPGGPPDGEIRVLRGGSWIDFAHLCRSACRFRLVPSRSDHDVGFRFAQVNQPRSDGTE